VGKFGDYRACIKTNGVTATIALLETAERLLLQLKCKEFEDLTKSKSTVATHCVADLLTYIYYIENVAYVTYHLSTVGCRCLVVRVVDALGLTRLLTLSSFQIHPYCIGSSGAVCSVAERRMSQATQRSAIRSWRAMSASPIVA